MPGWKELVLPASTNHVTLPFAGHKNQAWRAAVMQYRVNVSLMVSSRRFLPVIQ